MKKALVNISIHDVPWQGFRRNCLGTTDIAATTVGINEKFEIVVQFSNTYSTIYDPDIVF